MYAVEKRKRDITTWMNLEDIMLGEISQLK